MDCHNINGCNFGRYFSWAVDVIIWFVQRTIHLYNTELDCSIRNVCFGRKRRREHMRFCVWTKEKIGSRTEKNSMIDKTLLFHVSQQIIFLRFLFKKSTQQQYFNHIYWNSNVGSRLPRARLKCVQCAALENGFMIIEVWNRFAIVCERVRSFTENKPPIIKPFVKCVADGWCGTPERFVRLLHFIGIFYCLQNTSDVFMY